MGKTSVRYNPARYIYAYLPSVDIAEDWKARAKKAGVSTSEFVYEHVSNSLRQEQGEEGYKPRSELIDQLRRKDETIEKLTEDNKVARLALENVENQLRRYRAEPFLEENFRGVRKYDRELVELLQKGQEVDSDHLLRILKINPKQTDLVRAVSNQIQNLQAYGLIRKTRRGWKWTAK